MNVTSIEWTTFSANPLKYRDATGRVVWACEKLSPGCKNCYAEHLSTRYGGTRRAGDWNAATMETLTPFLDEAELHKMLTAKTVGGVPVSGSRCFVGDMTDIFGEWVPDDLLNRLFSDVLERRTDVTWQLLTKRAERMRQYLSWRWGPDEDNPRGRIPSRHIHVGVSCEDQPRADERIMHLLQTPAAVRFVSLEPLLDSIDLSKYYFALKFGRYPFPMLAHKHRTQLIDLIDWVIVGGESGASARPMHPDWARSIRDQCRAADVPFFFKQWGEWAPGECAEFTPTRTEHTATRFNDAWSFERLTPTQSRDLHRDDEPDVYRLGKKRAARLLDGQEWSEYPRVEVPA